MLSQQSGFSREYRDHVEAMVVRARRRPGLTMFLFAYFDESGKWHDKDGNICLCGFVSDGEHWNKFEEEWFDLLRKHGFKAIHMAEFYSQCRARGWSDERANEVLTEFVDKIRERVEFGFGIAVDGKYFRHKFKVAGKQEKDPKRFYTHRLLKRMRNVFVDSGYPLSLAITFDDDEEFALDCYKIISRLRKDKQNADLKEMIVSVGFAVDEVFTPLQAADILSHLSRERLTTGQIPPLLERLGTPAPDFILRFDGGELWDKAGIDKNWGDIQRAGDMPSRPRSGT
jgi:hypothetical protein